jgi:hypothetical protein
MNKKALAIVLAVVMAVSLFAVSAYAESSVGGTPNQQYYFWWFGNASTTPPYPAFQPTPMGDDAVRGYAYDAVTGELTIVFVQMTYRGTIGWFSSINAADAVWSFNDVTKIGTLTFAHPPAAPTMIPLTNVVVELETGAHIPLDNVWFELDYGA